MFGIGMQEVLIILVIALVIIGPKKLPEIAKALGKGYGEFRRAFEDMKDTINVDVRTDEERERLRAIRDREKPPEDEAPKPEQVPPPSSVPPVDSDDQANASGESGYGSGSGETEHRGG